MLDKDTGRTRMSIEFDIDTAFKVKKPCANCPFRKVGAIGLRPGRLEGVIQFLLEDDSHLFPCHKTVERTSDDVEEDGVYEINAEASACAGALSYLVKLGRIPVGMRVAHSLKLINIDDWDALGDLTIEPDQETLMPIREETTEKIR
jgi:hypothetical protein